MLGLPCSQLKLGDVKCSLLQCLLNVFKLLLMLLQLVLTSFLACRLKRAVKQQHDDDQTQQEDHCEDQAGQENSESFLDTAPTEEVQLVKLAKLCLHKVVPLVSTNVECTQSLVTQCKGVEIWAGVSESFNQQSCQTLTHMAIRGFTESSSVKGTKTLHTTPQHRVWVIM